MPPAGLGHFPRALTSRAPPGHHPDSREGRRWERPSLVLTSPPVPGVGARAAAGRTCPAQRGHGTQTALGKGLWCPALLFPPSLGVRPTVHTRYVHGDPAGPGPRRHTRGPDTVSQRSWATGGEPGVFWVEQLAERDTAEAPGDRGCRQARGGVGWPAGLRGPQSRAAAEGAPQPGRGGGGGCHGR